MSIAGATVPAGIGATGSSPGHSSRTNANNNSHSAEIGVTRTGRLAISPSFNSRLLF
jgi:hypothetical protein